MKPVQLPGNPRVLVVALRRLGDVLLTTPLIRSVKRAYPDARIDALVFAGTEGILAGNPDLAGIITIAQRSRVAKRYDLALSTKTGDRPTLLAAVAGRQSAGPVEAAGFAAGIKAFALSRSYVIEGGRHRPVGIVRLAAGLGI